MDTISITKFTNEQIVFEWLSISANRDKLPKVIVDEPTWKVFKCYGNIMTFLEREVEEKERMYVQFGIGWVCLILQSSINIQHDTSAEPIDQHQFDLLSRGRFDNPVPGSAEPIKDTPYPLATITKIT